MRPYSFSKLDMYLKCPRYYKFTYVEKIPAQKDSYSPSLEIHKFIGEYAQTGNRKLNLAVIEESDQEFVQNSFDSAVSVLNGLGKIVGVDVRFALDDSSQLTDFYDNDSLIRGVIDLITEQDDGLHVWDWKVGKQKNHNILQLRIYMLAVSRIFVDKKVVSAGLIYLPSTRCDIIQNDQSFEQVWNELKALIDKIENDKTFEPRIGEHCDYCPYQALCPIWSKVKKNGSRPMTFHNFMATYEKMPRELQKQIENIILDYIQDSKSAEPTI